MIEVNAGVEGAHQWHGLDDDNNDDDDDDDDVKWTTLVQRRDESAPLGTDCVYHVENEVAKKMRFRFCRIFIEKTKNQGNFPILHRVCVAGRDAVITNEEI